IRPRFPPWPAAGIRSTVGEPDETDRRPKPREWPVLFPGRPRAPTTNWLHSRMQSAEQGRRRLTTLTVGVACRRGNAPARERAASGYQIAASLPAWSVRNVATAYPSPPAPALLSRLA